MSGGMSAEPEGEQAEEPLAGGRTTAGVVRVGETVRRTRRPWTSSVRSVLRHLGEAGFTGAPRVLGFDDAGREVLAYLNGETVGDALPWPEWVSSDAALTDVGRWLRRLHDVTADFVPARDAMWFPARDWQPGHVIGHHDAAPYNAVWRQGQLVGFVDWDLAGPTSRDFDLAYTALMWVPLLAPDSEWPIVCNGQDESYRRLHLLLDAYRYVDDRSPLRTAVAARARRGSEVIRRLADDGDPMFQERRGQADDLDRAAQHVEDLPDAFWRTSATNLH